MTAGYDPSNPVASGTSDSYDYDRPRHADRSADEPERLGPLPPRMTSTGSFPAVGSPVGTGAMPASAQPTGAFPPQPTSNFPPQATNAWPVTPPPGPPPHTPP